MERKLKILLINDNVKYFVIIIENDINKCFKARAQLTKHQKTEN